MADTNGTGGTGGMGNGDATSKKASSSPGPKKPKPAPAAKKPKDKLTVARRNLRVIDGGGDEDVDRVIRTFACTDTGNAERLVHKFGDRLRYVPAWREYLVHIGTHWQRDICDIETNKLVKAMISEIEEEGRYEDTGGKKVLAKWRKQSESRGKRQAVIDLACAEPGVACSQDVFDSDPWILSVANGTLDLRTCELRPHDPKDLTTKCLPVAYDPRAGAPRFRRFMEEILPDKKVRDFVQRFLGYCLTGAVSERMFVIFLGGGSNGKTALINAIQNVLGEYSTVAASTLLTSRDKDQHPAEVAALFGVRLAVTSETKKGASFDEEKVKRLTGSDVLTARRMRENFWTFRPTHKLLIASNHKPRVKDATSSFWDRVAIVPFDVRFSGKKVDRKLGAKLEEEREGILAWLVEGCRQWRTGGLAPPDAVMSATKEYREEEDIAGRFLNECYVPDPTKTSFMYTRDILERNKTWAAGFNFFPISAKDLAEKLRMEPFECVATKRDGIAGWKGIKVKKKGEKDK